MDKGIYTVVKGDATKPQTLDHRVLVAHVCNTLGAFGAGFVLAITKAWGYRVKDKYQAQISTSDEKGEEKLGKVSYILCTQAPSGAVLKPQIVVANMIAQESTVNRDNPRPLKYNALARCMDDVARIVLKSQNENKCRIDSIHCPKFGSDLSGGDWAFIKELINDCWLVKGINVTVYEWEG